MVSYITNIFNSAISLGAPIKPSKQLNRWVNQTTASQMLANVEDYACCDCTAPKQACCIIKKKNNKYYAFCQECCDSGESYRNDIAYLEWIDRHEDKKPVIAERVMVVEYVEVTYPELSCYKRGDPIEGRICTTCCMSEFDRKICPATIVRDDIPICKDCNESWDLQETYLSEYYERKSFYDWVNKVRCSLLPGQQAVKVMERQTKTIEVL
jgi:hypothetical protein